MKFKPRGEAARLSVAALFGGIPAAAKLASGHHLTRTMKKIRCPNCAVVNLEKFVTYPHCAGCGTLLTEKEPRKPRWAAWKRPLGPILWATVVGGAVVAVVAALMLLSAKPVVFGRFDVTWEVQRRVSAGSTISMSLGLNTIDTRRISAFKDVTLRLDQDFLRDFPVVAFSPTPRSQSRLGKGIYFVFGTLPREQQISVKLRATRIGRHKMRASISAEGQEPDSYQAMISVGPNGAAAPEKRKP
jgi:hypothetical protein